MFASSPVIATRLHGRGANVIERLRIRIEVLGLRLRIADKGRRTTRRTKAEHAARSSRHFARMRTLLRDSRSGFLSHYPIKLDRHIVAGLGDDDRSGFNSEAGHFERRLAADLHALFSALLGDRKDVHS